MCVNNYATKDNISMTRGENVCAFIEAYCKIPEGAQVGRHLEGMAKDLSRWGKARADFDFAEKQIRKPPWYRALGEVSKLKQWRYSHRVSNWPFSAKK
tara:strand:- start:141 stop:434 length:294 start_codon:yes stop_codon:yes gene_type:complete